MECNEIEQCLDEIEEGTIHVKIIQDMARITVYKIWYVFLGLVEYYDAEEAALNDSSILMDDNITVMASPTTSEDLDSSHVVASVSSISSGMLAGINETSSQPWEVEQTAEIDKCTSFVQRSCCCKMADRKPCSFLFPVDYYIETRSQASLLTRQQLDLVLLGSVMSTTAVEKDVSCGRHKPTKRQRLSTEYMHRGYQLCKVTFNFLHGVGKHRVPAIRKYFVSNGLEVRTHGNTRRPPHHASSFITIKNTILFVQNYAEQNAILLPGRIPNQKRDDVKLLPSSDSKMVKL